LRQLERLGSDLRKIDPFDVLRPVYTKGPTSRSDLAEMLNLAPSLVGDLIRKALDDGILIEDGFAPSKGGRRPILLKANPDYAKLIGVDIGRSRTRVVVADFASTVLTWKGLPTETSKGKDHVLEVVLSELKSHLARFPGVSAIGIAHSGVISPETGTVLFWPLVEGWENTPLRQIVEDANRLPTFLVGDSVRAMAITEERFGQGKGLRRFVVVDVGLGVGSAIYLDGHLQIGRDGLAGELGHTTVDENGDLCSCGNRGCLELYSSASAIMRRIRSELERGITSSLANEVRGRWDQLSLETIVAAAKAHDRLAERVLSEAGMHLGTALASVVNLLNPEKVILAGKVPQVAGEIILGPLLYNLRQRALPLAVKDLPVVVSQFGEETAALGMTLVAGEGVLKAAVAGSRLGTSPSSDAQSIHDGGPPELSYPAE
jgi:predicted NBD/HSP70 family sugar kinase